MKKEITLRKIWAKITKLKELQKQSQMPNSEQHFHLYEKCTILEEKIEEILVMLYLRQSINNVTRIFIIPILICDAFAN
jgi:hypothetical protein